MTKAKSKKERVTAALLANPHRSNTAIARATKTCTWTVGHWRRRMEAAGELPYIKQRVGIDGRVGRGPAPYHPAQPEPHCAVQPVYQPLQNETQSVLA